MSISTAAAAGAPAAPTPIANRDFPTWLPAMFVKELRQGLRTRGFAYAFIGLQVLMAIVMASAAADASSSNSFSRASAFSLVDGFFWTLIALQILLATPGRALGSLQLEVTSRTIDLLMLTRLNAWRIVTAKWGSLMAQSILLLVSMLPYAIVRYYLGPVDLVRDAWRIVALLSAGGLLTAAGLWGAGMGKAFRYIVIAVVIFGSSVVRGGLPALFRGSPIGFYAPGVMSTPYVLIWFNGVLILLFFLVAAVRNIAPPAENHSLLARSLPVLAVLPVFAMGAFGGLEVLRMQQLLFAGVFLILVGMTELGSVAVPMAVHLRAAPRLTAFSRVLLNMTLPGWPSAMLYAILATILWVACALVLDWTTAGPAINPGYYNRGSFGYSSLPYYAWPWIALLGLSAMLFPPIVISLLKRRPKQATGLYFVMFAATLMILPLTFAVASVSRNLRPLKAIVETLPGASFVATIFQVDVENGGFVVLPQALVAIAVLVTAFWFAKPYWVRLETLKAGIRPGPK